MRRGSDSINFISEVPTKFYRVLPSFSVSSSLFFFASLDNRNAISFFGSVLSNFNRFFVVVVVVVVVFFLLRFFFGCCVVVATLGRRRWTGKVENSTGVRTSLIYCLRFMSRLGMKRKEEEEEEEEEGEEEKEEEEGEEGERNGTHETTKNPLHVSAIDRRNFFFLFFFFFFLIFFRFSKFLFVPWRRNCETAEEKKINFPMKSTKSNDRHPAPNVRTRFKKKNKQTKKQTKGNGTVRLICFGQQRQRRKESKRRGGRRGENFYLQKKKTKKKRKKKRERPAAKIASGN